jgi:hypothetical protein
MAILSAMMAAIVATEVSPGRAIMSSPTEWSWLPIYQLEQANTGITIDRYSAIPIELIEGKAKSDR